MAEFKLLSDKLSKDFVLDFVYNTLSLEGNVITKEEVSKVMNGEEVSEKSKQLITNSLNGLNFILNLLEEDVPLDENKLKDLHEVIMNGISLGGLYRNVDISIKGSNHTPPSYLKVYDRMKKYFDSLLDPTMDVWEKIAFSHLQLAKIHPFLDGNGRLARLVLNYELLLNGFKPVIIYKDKKNEYFNLLEEFKVNKNINPFIDFLKSQQ